MEAASGFFDVNWLLDSRSLIDGRIPLNGWVCGRPPRESGFFVSTWMPAWMVLAMAARDDFFEVFEPSVDGPEDIRHCPYKWFQDGEVSWKCVIGPDCRRLFWCKAGLYRPDYGDLCALLDFNNPFGVDLEEEKKPVVIKVGDRQVDVKGTILMGRFLGTN